MDRKHGTYRSKKVKFHGNRFTKKKQESGTKTAGAKVGESVQLPGVHDGAGTSSATNTDQANLQPDSGPVRSASKRKFGQLYEGTDVEPLQKKGKDNNEEHISPSGNMIIDIGLLSELVSEVCHCSCGEKLRLEVCKRSGLAATMKFVCTGLNCGNERMWHTSTKVGNNSFTTNKQFVYAMSCIGKGRAAGEEFCGVMNMNAPCKQKSWDKHFQSVLHATESVAKESMKAAARQLQNGDKVTDTAVTCDGTWQKRGHSSLHGVVTVLSSETGKVLDYEPLSRYCHACSNKKDMSAEEKEAHREVCASNYDGSAPAMEPVGMVRIFHRSEKERNLRYVTYIGDGDSKSFHTVKESKPYQERD